MSNGVVGSPAFAAYDQGLLYFSKIGFLLNKKSVFWHYHMYKFVLFSGYDVFLGNLRGLVSREHINKNISSRE